MAQAQEHQEYISQRVNPVLENLVTQLLMERPEQLAPFMIKWLSERVKAPATSNTEETRELADLKQELAQLQAEVRILEAEAQAPAKAAAQEAEDDEEDEESDDEGELCPPPASYMQRERTSVSAEAYGTWNQKKEFVPPVHSKSDSQKSRILAVLKESFLFSSLDATEVDVVINAMTERVCSAEEVIISQGDEGDRMYIVETGEAHCFKRSEGGEEKKIKECGPGDFFGELALLYNCPRAASVVSQGASTLWCLDRDTFNAIVRDSSIKRRERYENFLKKVPILESMEGYEILQMCDALQTENHAAGSIIVQQGDPGDKFYIVEDGECTALKAFVTGAKPQEVMQYRPGDYFGELALLDNEPRAASVIAKTECKVLTMDRRTYKRLMGPLSDILRRNAARYT